MNERIIFKLPIIKYFRARYLKKHEEYSVKNKKEVLLLYRKFHKIIPKICPRTLVKQAKLEVNLNILFINNFF